MLVPRLLAVIKGVATEGADVEVRKMLPVVEEEVLSSSLDVVEEDPTTPGLFTDSIPLPATLVAPTTDPLADSGDLDDGTWLCFWR